jgi:UV DNA damage repair endonuclease
MTKKIGFACKWIDHPGQVDGIKPKDAAKQYNTGTTTITWLNRQSKAVSEQKLWDLMVQNLEATRKLVERVGQLEENLRMVRLSSDILPAYTESTWSYFWRRLDVIDYCSRNFRIIGNSARASGIKLSFHPGQFCVLASESTQVVDRSIEEFEYHVDMVRWMGYGKSFQDFKINVHIAGRAGPEGIRRALQRMSPEARNTITIENEEITWGLDSTLELAKDLALVLDIHHHWIKTGEYIENNDDRIKRVIDSWRGVRPTIHYSVSREDVLIGHSGHERPALLSLMETGHKKGKLRAHSDFYWNDAVNLWAVTHNTWADIMCEAKGKNLASFKLKELADAI